MAVSVTQTLSWKNLFNHYNENRYLLIEDLFSSDDARAEDFSISAGDLFADYSKNIVTRETLSLLMALARESELEDWRSRMLRGDIVNQSEGRAATHAVIRRLEEDKSLEGSTPYTRLFEFAEDVRSGRRVSHSGKRFRHIVCLGIGGSRLGNEMACRALEGLAHPDIQIHFVSAADGSVETLKHKFDFSETLFIVISKSFVTDETLFNAEDVKRRLTDLYSDSDAWKKHFVGVSADERGMEMFGIDEELRFLMPESVGGRYSIWSAAGLPLLIAVGAENFRKFLEGARAMDEHFAEQPLERNMPVILGLIGLWYASFFRADNRAIFTYGMGLELLSDYLQQLEMESNGKSVTRDGVPCDYPTAPSVWGGSAPDAQHAFFQLLHQGSRSDFIPVDFIAVQHARNRYPSTFDERLYANLLAQSAALMSGQREGEPHQQQPGNRPSNVIILKFMTPYALGSLLALHEHRTFVQAVVWRINPFDQWGVELGKHIFERLLPVLSADEIDDAVDASTANLIKRYHPQGDS